MHYQKRIYNNKHKKQKKTETERITKEINKNKNK